MDHYSHYSLWIKSNKNFLYDNVHFQGPIINRGFRSSSWEEQAFAYNSGFMWPPRSYSCSFCKREFRSAQALGGHMNVHRRDRARLKLPLSPQSDQVAHDQLNHNNPSQVCYEDSNLDLSPSRVSPDSKTAVEKGTGRGDFAESSLFMGWNSVLSQKQLPAFGVDQEVITSQKRHKTITVSSSFQRSRLQSEMLGLKTGSLEDLDLELRLGDPPKVK